MMAMQYIYMPRYTAATTIGPECAGRWPSPTKLLKKKLFHNDSAPPSLSDSNDVPWSPFFDLDSSRSTTCNIVES